MAKTKTVFLGMSGGVDSSVCAYLLKQQGYKVVGVYMKNWSQDLPGMKCPWSQDLADAKRVATILDIDFKVFDFQKQYRQKVVDYMIEEYQKGHTPNPDIMCNQEIKFKLFFDVALGEGADLIATGHYAKTDGKNLLRATDSSKDQTYFLYRMPTNALASTIFPLADMKKTAVKQLATDLRLPVATKKESMGVCFIGETGIREFLSEFVDTQPGQIREIETEQVLGSHDGAIFYTLGQRHGLYLTTGLPYYVVQKDIKNNIVYVSKNLNHPNLWRQSITLKDVFIRTPYDRHPRAGPGDPVDLSAGPNDFLARIRHRAPLEPATFDPKTNIITFSTPQKSLTPGQSIVFYTGEHHQICLGGGVIA